MLSPWPRLSRSVPCLCLSEQGFSSAGRHAQQLPHCKVPSLPSSSHGLSVQHTGQVGASIPTPGETQAHPNWKQRGPSSVLSPVPGQPVCWTSQPCLFRRLRKHQSEGT